MDDGLNQTKCGVFKVRTRVKGWLVSQPQVGSSGTLSLVRALFQLSSQYSTCIVFKVIQVLCRQLTSCETSI
jgi:hypothetical protein